MHFFSHLHLFLFAFLSFLSWSNNNEAIRKGCRTRCKFSVKLNSVARVPLRELDMPTPFRNIVLFFVDILTLYCDQITNEVISMRNKIDEHSLMTVKISIFHYQFQFVDKYFHWIYNSLALFSMDFLEWNEPIGIDVLFSGTEHNQFIQDDCLLHNNSHGFNLLNALGFFIQNITKI